MSVSPTSTAAAFGASLFNAVLKQKPADFVVDELFDIELAGHGEHLYVHLEKAGLNTADLVDLMQKTYSVSSADVGLCGLKDRHALTRQWLSVRTPDTHDALVVALKAMSTTAQRASILQATRHVRKLRRGAHRGNRFTVVLRDVVSTVPGSDSNRSATDSVARPQIDQRIGQITQRGFPNLIGPQRFGFGGQNLVRARQWFRQPRKRTSRQQRSLWLSAARSAVFNEVCAARVQANTWESLLSGEPAVLNGSRSFFDTDGTPAEELSERLLCFDIHPSAPWWGKGEVLARGSCAEFESQVLTPYADLCDGLAKAGLPQERRALRAVAQGMTHEWLDHDTLQLSFSLEPGVFATTMLAQLGICSEPDRR